MTDDFTNTVLNRLGNFALLESSGQHALIGTVAVALRRVWTLGRLDPHDRGTGVKEQVERLSVRSQV